MTDKDSAHFLELETSLHKREIRASAEALSRLLAEDFIEFGSSGRVFNRPGIIQALGEEQGDLRVTVENFAIKELAANVVLATYVARRSGEGQSSVVTRTLRSSIWKRVDGNWQMLFHQGTIIPSAS